MFKPTGGTINLFELPLAQESESTHGYAGYKTSTRYDSLLAKLIVHSKSADFSVCAEKTVRALRQFRLEGFNVNLPFLQALVGSTDFQDAGITTRYVDTNLPSLTREEAIESASGKAGLAGTKLATKDPLAVLALGKSTAPSQAQEVTTLSTAIDGPAGTIAVNAPLQGTIAALSVKEGDLVFTGQELVVMDAMKMEHVIQAPVSGQVAMVTVESGDAIVEDHPILFIAEQDAIEGEAKKLQSWTSTTFVQISQKHRHDTVTSWMRTGKQPSPEEENQPQDRKGKCRGCLRSRYFCRIRITSNSRTKTPHGAGPDGEHAG
ncbi:MAG: biotin/lipoyl-containing protein [Candidatus Azotimanducaceae bacterium WSBS_2022_MAG_OTU7]